MSIKSIAITIGCVIAALVIYEFGKKALGLDSYEENYELLNQ